LIRLIALLIRVSLGIVIWQILTDGAPYQHEDDMYLHNPAEESAILSRCLERSSVPGDFPSDLPSPLVEIVHNCWSPIGQGRPSAMVVASSLRRVWASLDPIVIRSGPGGIENPFGPNNLEALERARARSAAWSLVRRARQRQESRDEELEQLGENHLSVILRYADDPSYPECTFLVGAMIWWKLINIRLIGDFVSTRAFGPDGQRAELALSYLLRASDGGYKNANMEISHAYATLYHDYKDRVSCVYEF
jgi:hypothetical protein